MQGYLELCFQQLSGSVAQRCIDGVQQCHALLGIPRGGFADQQGGVDGILIPAVGAGQITVALFEAEDVAVCLARGFQQADLFADN